MFARTKLLSNVITQFPRSRLGLAQLTPQFNLFNIFFIMLPSQITHFRFGSRKLYIELRDAGTLLLDPDIAVLDRPYQGVDNLEVIVWLWEIVWKLFAVFGVGVVRRWWCERGRGGRRD